jgi:hypothetical protein
VRRLAVGAVALVFGAMAVAVLAYAATTLYAQFGAPRVEANTLGWAERTPLVATGSCAQCHPTPTTSGTPHAVVLCETCHVPTVPHPGTVAGVVQALPAATSAACVACHRQTPGRPTPVAAVDPTLHYASTDCLACHDPHTTAAQKPPEVTHPLANLPACTTCHAPSGLKRFPEGHQLAADGVCLACHLPGRTET